MPVDNSSNPGRGRDFETLSADLLSAHFKVPFQKNVPIAIGDPAKIHKFDLVSEDKRYVGECKNHTWTETGNIPSAKMAFLNQAVLYLSLLPFPCERFLVMPRSVHERRTENLAGYYFRTYQHLLNGVFISEVIVETSEIVELGRK
jgi:hypothetical protein